MKRISVFYLLLPMMTLNATPHVDIDTLIGRLEIHITQLQNVQEQQKVTTYIFEDSETKTFTFSDMISFDHNLIRWCIKTMEKRKNLSPLFDTWETFKTYRYVEGLQAPLFIRECALLILIIYNNILVGMSSSNHARINAQEISILFNKVAGLPLHELIDVLDKIRSELSSILEAHPLKPHQTLLQWLQENWWVPPTVVAGIIVAILFRQ